MLPYTYSKYMMEMRRTPGSVGTGGMTEGGRYCAETEVTMNLSSFPTDSLTYIWKFLHKISQASGFMSLQTRDNGLDG
jgi:hypothetical protein